MSTTSKGPKRKPQSADKSKPNLVKAKSSYGGNRKVIESSGQKRQRPAQAQNDEHAADEKWSKSKKKRMRLLKGKSNQLDNGDQADNDVVPTNVAKRTAATSVHPSTRGTPESKLPLGQKRASAPSVAQRSAAATQSPFSSSLQKSFQERLSGSRFRILNEELYTSTSTSAFERFQQNPSLFDEYHEGFRHQVEQWPVNPVTILVDRLQSSVDTMSDSAAKKTRGKVVVADFGCGDAALARQLLAIRDDTTKQCPFVVHSFDLVAGGPNAELITASDVAHTPLTKESIDVGIFCLSLMGTNLSDFIREAHRVLKPNGILHIAEVRSRFENIGKKEKKAKGKKSSAETDDLQSFLKVLDELGFRTCHTDRSNTMFVLLDLKKNGKEPKKDLAFTAKPCIYKRR